MEAHASDLAMTQQPDRQLDPSLPNAARMQAIGDLLARGIRRLNDIDLTPLLSPQFTQ